MFEVSVLNIHILSRLLVLLYVYVYIIYIYIYIYVCTDLGLRLH